MLSGIAMSQPVDPDQNSRTARANSESVDPTPELSRSLNAHYGKCSL